jgi:hypothetical protein
MEPISSENLIKILEDEVQIELKWVILNRRLSTFLNWLQWLSNLSLLVLSIYQASIAINYNIALPITFLIAGLATVNTLIPTLRHTIKPVERLEVHDKNWREIKAIIAQLRANTINVEKGTELYVRLLKPSPERLIRQID